MRFEEEELNPNMERPSTQDLGAESRYCTDNEGSMRPNGSRTHQVEVEGLRESLRVDMVSVWHSIFCWCGGSSVLNRH